MVCWDIKWVILYPSSHVISTGKCNVTWHWVNGTHLTKHHIQEYCFVYCGPSFTFPWQKFKNFGWFDRLLTGVFYMKHCLTCLVICVWGSIFYLWKICFLISKQTAGLLVLINGFQPTQPLINFSLFFLLLHTFNEKIPYWRQKSYITDDEEISLQ